MKVDERIKRRLKLISEEYEEINDRLTIVKIGPVYKMLIDGEISDIELRRYIAITPQYVVMQSIDKQTYTYINNTFENNGTTYDEFFNFEELPF